MSKKNPALPGVLHVTAIEGKDLASKDSNGLSDPYVKVVMWGCKDKKAAVEQKTKPIDKTLNPQWNHKFAPLAYDSEDYAAVRVVIYDKDKLVDEFMGQVIIPIIDIKNEGGKFDKWYKVYTNDEAHYVSGTIHLGFELITEEDNKRRQQEEEKLKQQQRQEEERKKLEEQQKQLELLNEKKKELERQRDLNLSQQRQMTQQNLAPPPMNTQNKVGNATCSLQFVGQSETELSMNVGDDITVNDSSDPNWWYATNHTSGGQGYIPAQGGYVTFGSVPMGIPPPMNTQNKVGNATCALQYVGQSETELSMNVGDDITVDDRSDPNWWYATNHTSGGQGYIPAQGGYIN